MKTLNYPKRVMIPPPELSHFASNKCAWCNKKIKRGEVASFGKDLGKDVLVCSKCATPPNLGERVSEIKENQS